MADARTREAILSEARARFGVKYGLPPGPGETDCSKYVKDVYEAAGLPFSPGVRVAEQERQDTVPIPFEDVLPGDLLFFEHTYDAPGPAGADGKIASHIGISLGAGSRKMLDANDGRGDSGETNIGTPYWQGHIFEARRHRALVGNVVTPVPTPGALPEGVDVASHQGAVDWKRVAAAGITFGFTKASGGSWYQNPTMAANWAGMKAAGIKRGAYHYAFETSGQPFPGDGPEAEAEWFLNTVLPLGVEPGDMLVLDIEDGDGLLGEWALRWCERVEKRVGFPPLVYTGAWFSVPHGFGAVPELARFQLWLAAYQETIPRPPAPWDRVAIHQYTSDGSVPGINGKADRNVFNGSRDQLALFGKSSPGIPVPVPTPPTADPRDAEIAALHAEIAAARTALGVASVDYANAIAEQIRQLQTIEAAYRKLNPAA